MISCKKPACSGLSQCSAAVNSFFPSCILQRLGDHRSVRWRPFCAANFSAAPSAETGAFHARPPPPAGGPDEDNGQRSHLLHVAHALHLYLQVPEASAVSLLQLIIWLA